MDKIEKDHLKVQPDAIKTKGKRINPDAQVEKMARLSFGISKLKAHLRISNI